MNASKKPPVVDNSVGQDSILLDIDEAISNEAKSPEDLYKYYKSMAWVQLPFFILKSKEYMKLTYADKVVFIVLLMSQKERDNGELEILPELKKQMRFSGRTMKKALEKLVKAGILYKTKSGRSPKYAVFWRQITKGNLKDKLDLINWVNQQRSHFQKYVKGVKAFILGKKATEKINNFSRRSLVGNYVQLHHFLIIHEPLVQSDYSTLVILTELLMSLDKKHNGLLELPTSIAEKRGIDAATRKKGLMRLKDLGIILETEMYQHPNKSQKFAIFWRSYDIDDPYPDKKEAILEWIKLMRKKFYLLTKGKEKFLRYV